MASERQIVVGGIPIGGGAPVSVQSMTTTKTHDVEATLEQIGRLREAGADIVRVAVPGIPDADALPAIVAAAGLPIIADIHFNSSLALRALDTGVAGVRINPGNIGGPDKVEAVVRKAQKTGTPLRIGANSGSLPEHLRPMATADPAGALVAAALEEVELLERLDFGNFKISVKSSSVPVMIEAYRRLAAEVTLSAAPGRDRGGPAGRRHRQVGRRHRHAAGRGHRRHDPRLADGRSGGGDRAGDGHPQGARAAPVGART